MCRNAQVGTGARARSCVRSGPVDQDCRNLPAAGYQLPGLVQLLREVLIGGFAESTMSVSIRTGTARLPLAGRGRGGGGKGQGPRSVLVRITRPLRGFRRSRSWWALPAALLPARSFPDDGTSLPPCPAPRNGGVVRHKRSNLPPPLPPSRCRMGGGGGGTLFPLFQILRKDKKGFPSALFSIPSFAALPSRAHPTAPQSFAQFPFPSSTRRGKGARP